MQSKWIEGAVEAFSSLPGIGKKTALRLTLHLLQQPPEQAQQFSAAIREMREKVRFCERCHNLSDDKLCAVCTAPKRDQSTICIVEGVRDLMAIEQTQQYNGLYHVLGGVIAPIEGIGPDDLNIGSLVERIEKGEVKEIIMAISPTIEGDTTIFYLAKQLKAFDLRISTIARGVSFGGELEYADELTLGRSIQARTPYSNE